MVYNPWLGRLRFRARPVRVPGAAKVVCRPMFGVVAAMAARLLAMLG
jgi:hypothetical protein